MIQINPTKELSVEAICSQLLKRKRIATRFRFPYTDKQVYCLLLGACEAEVKHRHKVFDATQQYKQHLWDISKWLTSDDSSFGLFLCGSTGNGKTTIIKALKELFNWLTSDEPYSSAKSVEFPIRGYKIVSAKDLVRYAKAYNNPTKDNTEDVNQFKLIRDIEILAIDDLGTEPRESIHYGDFVTAAMDILSYRYDEQLCTLCTTNLGAEDIETYYDKRIKDRFREMMLIINFKDESSFR